MTDDWRDRAACKFVDPNLFFPERGDYVSGEYAKAVCAECPVVEPCLQYALDMCESVGIWGGTSARERKRLRSERNPQNLLRPIPHGTAAGYKAHWRRRQPPCDACILANRLKQAEYKERKLAAS